MNHLKYFFTFLLIVRFIIPDVFAQKIEKISYEILPFGEDGQIKMLYDRRQRPQSVFLNGKVHIVFNAGSEKGTSEKSKSKPMVVTYNPDERTFSDVVTLGPAKNDHHFCPVIWADINNFLHVLYGCHKTPGTHLVSKKPSSIGSKLEDWKVESEIVSSISYPTFYKVFDDKELVYYRTAGHTSSWTYRISEDNGKTWYGPTEDVTDLDCKGRFEWSSYQTKLPSKDGRYLHVVFTAYDDNKANDPERYYNRRYKKAVSNEWKYNLYYIKIDLETQEVTNFEGDEMISPIDLDYANKNCLIWDTEWRGAGIPPDIVIDENDNPAFLHILSEENTETHNYYFVRNINGEWKKTVISPSNQQWNGCHIQKDKNGIYHAYIVTGGEYLATKWIEGQNEAKKMKDVQAKSYKGGFMDKHGGGKIEEWVSADNGDSWKFLQDLTPAPEKYPGWKFNNVQPVTKADGSIVDGMLLFYGWKDKDAAKAKGFLLHKKN